MPAATHLQSPNIGAEKDYQESIGGFLIIVVIITIMSGGGETSPPDLGAHLWVHTEGDLADGNFAGWGQKKLRGGE